MFITPMSNFSLGSSGKGMLGDQLAMQLSPLGGRCSCPVTPNEGAAWPTPPGGEVGEPFSAVTMDYMEVLSSVRNEDRRPSPSLT